MKNEIEVAVQSKQVLRQILLDKIKANSAYSARAFARDIGVSSAYVTMVLNGKKKINLERAMGISRALKLDEHRTMQLVGAVLKENGLSLEYKSLRDKKMLTDLSEEQFAVIADWYHFAILDLTTTKNFHSNISWISKRLGLKTIEVEHALDRLVKVGLLIKTKNGFKKTQANIDLPTKTSVAAVREHQKQMIDRAKMQLEKIDQKSFENRMICSATFAANISRLEEARKMVLDFQHELSQFLSAGEDCTEVFQLNTQLFSHTKDIK